MRSIWNNIAITSAARIYSLLIGLLTLFLTARLLGPEGRGQVAAINTWVNMFSSFAYLSLGQVALHRMTNDRQHDRFGKLLGSLILMTALLTVLGWLLALGWYWLRQSEAFKGLPLTPLMLGFASLPFMLWEQYGSSLLIGLKQLALYNRWQVIGRTVSVIAMFVLVTGFESGITGVIEAGLLGQILIASAGTGFLFSFARRKGLSSRPDYTEIKALIFGGVKLHLNAIGSFLFTSANVLILNHYYGAKETGYFQLAMQLLGILMIIPQAANMEIFGEIARLGPNGAWPNNKRLLIQTTSLMIVLSLFSGLLAPWGITLLTGDAFQPAVTPFRWMLSGLIGMTFSTIMAPQWIGRGYFWQTAVLTFIIGILNLACNFYLIPKYGIKGAVYAFLATYAISIVGNGTMAYHCQVEYKKSKLL